MAISRRRLDFPIGKPDCVRLLLTVIILISLFSVTTKATPATIEYSVIAPLASQSLLLDGVTVGNRLIAVGERGHILVAEDSSRSWVQSKVPTQATLTGVYFHDKNLVWAVGHDAVILRTTDGGKHWTRVHYAQQEEAPLFDVWFKDGQEFGVGNRVLITLMAKQRNIFTPEFFKVLRLATDEVFFIPGVDRAQVKSLFTPNTRFTEVVEDGISGGNVVPGDFQPTPQGLAKVRENILKANILGRLVANDFSSAIISAELMEFDPNTGERLDYLVVARLLEEKIRDRFESDVIGVHIIGFAKIVGDITGSASRVVLFLE